MRSALLKKISAWLLVLCTAASFAACGTDSEVAKKGVVISEVVSSNGQSYEHDYYGSPDWIELHNESDQPINLLGWGVTDNIKNSDKAFTLPEIVLPADGYLLLLATKMEKTDTLAWDGTSPICLGFSLKSAGEDLVLINPHMQTIDELAVPQLNRDVSYARRSDGTYSAFLFSRTMEMRFSSVRSSALRNGMLCCLQRSVVASRKARMRASSSSSGGWMNMQGIPFSWN